ncbi:FctA domain-containing protein, partial [Vibrio sp. FNV 38]|nr:FctA domain-containing protein [Vibrio sp. FNV 38]
LGERTFSFRLTDPDGKTETISGVKQGEVGTFNEIVFEDLTKTGTYEYTIEEVNDGQPGVTYDAHKENVTIVVTDVGTGKLSVTYNGKSSFTTPVWTNTYAANGTATLSAKKAGENLGERTFSFMLTDPDGKT